MVLGQGFIYLKSVYQFIAIDVSGSSLTPLTNSMPLSFPFTTGVRLKLP
jgi:hypothetical protein